MYALLLFVHSAFRWLVLLSLVYAVLRAMQGLLRKRTFTLADNRMRHITATIAHIQLVLGLSLYLKSPIVQYFFANTGEAMHISPIRFFGVEHIFAMVIAVVLITIGSALAKRRSDDRRKFRTILLWHGIALLIIFIVIPWPFSPIAQRPYLRTY